MEDRDYKTMTTAHGELRYYRDLDCEGAIVMVNPQTIDKYNEYRNQHPDTDKLGVFFAFSAKQYDEGRQQLLDNGFIKDGDKIMRASGGLFGTKQSLDKFYGAYMEIDEKIKNECDPQEIYFYEYNNHECMISWDGDTEPVKIIIHLFGEEEARKLKRYDRFSTIDEIMKKED